MPLNLFMLKCKLIIFDLDGTLLNTFEDLGNSVNYVLKKYGYPLHSMDNYKTFIGNGIDNLLTRSLPEDFADGEKFQCIRKDFVEHYEAHKYDLTRPYEGILNLLRELSEKEIQLAVASNKYDAATKELVARYFGEFEFQAVLGHREDKPKKPNPTIVYDILESTGISNEETLYVGDSAVDMKTAYNSDVRSVGVTWGFRSEEELRENYADFIVHHPREILQIVG